MDLIINFYKDRGITSNDALTKVKRMFKSKKAGHGGTLDPLAEGVLIIGLNNATKIFPYLSNLPKEYIFIAHLGITTDTYDSEGKIIEQKEANHITKEMIQEILPSFLGQISQRPPIYSALKYKGMPLYEYARKGIPVDTKERVITVYHIEMQSFEPPYLTLLLRCSSGTYVRSICHDLGKKLGVGAHITMLKRTRIGQFSINDAVRIDELPSSTKGLYTIEQTLSHLPNVRFSNELALSAKNGNSIPLERLHNIDDLNGNNFVVLLDEKEQVFAIGQIKANKLFVKRLLMR